MTQPSGPRSAGGRRAAPEGLDPLESKPGEQPVAPPPAAQQRPASAQRPGHGQPTPPASAVPESVPRFATGDQAPAPQQPQPQQPQLARQPQLAQQPEQPRQQPLHAQQPSQPPAAQALPGLTNAQESPAGALVSSGGVVPDASRQLLWRAKKGAKPIVALWLTATATGCELSSDVYPVKSLRVDPVHAGPYRFQNADDAHAFAQEAARALMHLGCEVASGERRPGAEDPPASPSS